MASFSCRSGNYWVVHCSDILGIPCTLQIFRSDSERSKDWVSEAAAISFRPGTRLKIHNCFAVFNADAHFNDKDKAGRAKVMILGFGLTDVHNEHDPVSSEVSHIYLLHIQPWQSSPFRIFSGIQTHLQQYQFNNPSSCFFSCPEQLNR